MSGPNLSSASPEPSRIDRLITAWALAGVGCTLVIAVVRLSTRGWTTVTNGLSPIEWGVLALTSTVFFYGEGVMALERRWVPRVVKRARQLRAENGAAVSIGGPLYAMGLIGAPPRHLVRSWLGLAAIIAAILIVRSFEEPWRGIVDLSVAGALAWGTIALIRSFPDALS
jgi:hypothetical protein